MTEGEEVYLDRNRETYDKTAEEFQRKRDIRLAGTQAIVEWFSSYVDGQVPEPQILELGPGSGEAARLMNERGYDVTAIEFSSKMAELARQTAPQANIIVNEFLAHEFGDEQFDGIFALAFIHLFAKPDAEKVMQKMHRLLRPGGYACAVTTMHEKYEEGFFGKRNFPGQPNRFRVRYTSDRFTDLLSRAGFDVVESMFNNDQEEQNKRWMNIILTKTN